MQICVSSRVRGLKFALLVFSFVVSVWGGGNIMYGHVVIALFCVLRQYVTFGCWVLRQCVDGKACCCKSLVQLMLTQAVLWMMRALSKALFSCTLTPQ